MITPVTTTEEAAALAASTRLASKVAAHAAAAAEAKREVSRRPRTSEFLTETAELLDELAGATNGGLRGRALAQAEVLRGRARLANGAGQR